MEELGISASMLLFLGVFFLILFLFTVYFLAVQTTWLVIDCATSQRSPGKKIVWIIALLLAFPISTLAYGWFATSKKAIRIISHAYAVFLLLTVIIYVAVIPQEFKEKVRQKTIELEQQELRRLGLAASE